MFDLYTYPFSVRDNTEYTNVSGYLVGTSDRKIARTRLNDVIILKFSSYRKLDTDEELVVFEFLEKTNKFYFKTNGPITTVTRKSGEFLNELLIKYNLSKNIREIINGSFQFLVLRNNEAYFVHCGSPSAFVISKIHSYQFDEKVSGSQGLGVSKIVKFKFFHAELQSGDRIILCDRAPSTWTIETLTEDPRISISHLRKTLLQKQNQDFSAIILQVRTGSGNVHQLKLENQTLLSTSVGDLQENLKSEESEIKEIIPLNTDDSPVNEVDEPKLDSGMLSTELSDYLSKDQIPTPPFLQEDYSRKEDNLRSRPRIERGVTLDKGEKIETSLSNKSQFREVTSQSGDDRGQITNSDTDVKAFEEPRKPIINRTGLIRFLNSFKLLLVKITSNSEKINKSLSENTAKLISRTNPSSKDTGTTLSSTSMFFMAILVPILVVAISMTVYFRSGRVEQHDKFVFQANQLVIQANSETDVTKRVVIFQDALLFLDEAEKYGTTETSDELRSIIQDELDNLQGVTRIRLQNTIAGGLDRRIQINRMIVSTSEDLYALDEGTGRVIRLVFTNNDYDVDTSFICGPGNYEQTVVHELVDIESITISNSLNAVVIGIDRGGNLLLCSVNKAPTAIKLNLPEMGWGQIKAIAFNGYSIYILDVDEKTRDLYRLPANGLKFDENPESIFSGNIPENLININDMAIYDDQLFLVRNTGELMNCSIGIAEINCIQSIGYGFIQQGQTRSITDVVTGVDFSQVQTTQPPDPSIFFMDRLNSAVYHFSLALNMQKQIRPNFVGAVAKPEGPITAFTVSPYGIIHFAYGHQLFFGYLP
ncbi:MAG: hypothetical protein CVU46_05895 [Chloroflexi bacterium HGW-Chloroflexi-8]|nr:MAG: hypothetical protein CVU46_05895 [Chloroflexi bacterium HGW-Chloroflexi-8]